MDQLALVDLVETALQNEDIAPLVSDKQRTHPGCRQPSLAHSKTMAQMYHTQLLFMPLP